MNRLLVVALVALALPAGALAKGPSAASIEGPGVGKALPVAGKGEDGGASRLGRLTQDAGFFPAVFGQSPDPTLRVRPKGELGPRYVITYTVPGPSGESVIRQDVYPYAKPVPLTFMKPDQPFWDGQRTYGGWYVSTPALRQTLVAAGLPAEPPSLGDGFWSVPALAGVSAAIAAALVLLLVAARWIRRRPRPITA